MTIYILDQKPEINAQLLDNKSLGKMISACAQVLCNVHYIVDMDNLINKTNYKCNQPPLAATKNLIEWNNWTRTCLANYQLLLSYARACCQEWQYRFSCSLCLSGVIHASEFDEVNCQRIKIYKHHDVIEWCSENVPELPMLKPGYRKNSAYMDNRDMLKPTPFPLEMHEKYKIYYIKYADGYKDRFTKDDLKKEGWDMPPDAVLDITESYRNYYRAKLKKMTECKACEDGLVRDPLVTCKGCCNPFTTCHICNGNCYIKQEPKFTRREKPEFLGDL